MAQLVKSGPVAVTKEGGKANLEKTVKSGSLVALFVCAMLLVVLSERSSLRWIYHRYRRRSVKPCVRGT